MTEVKRPTVYLPVVLFGSGISQSVK